MAPEIFLGKVYGESADMWSLGVTLFMLCVLSILRHFVQMCDFASSFTLQPMFEEDSNYREAYRMRVEYTADILQIFGRTYNGLSLDGELSNSMIT